MKNILILCSLFLVFSGCSKQNEEVEAVMQLASRILPHHHTNFIFEKIPSEHGKDVFELESKGNKILIKGNTGVAMGRGLHTYLRKYCHKM